ncbi:ABC transporter permease [Desulfotomaculum sp. 1211_IL3151]|uniref:ABC transporter permease n=1 Tax=Desulfotomaculum sp. 1211_IL3151 TaxID=3084055 RepID=UPI002FDAF67A
MRSFLLKRLGLGVLVLLGVITVTFFITRVIPSDPAAKWVGPRATPQQIEVARVELGLDQPLYVQFGKYVVDLSQGDFGKSLRSHQPVAEELKSYLPATIELVVLSTMIAVFLGIPLGVLSAKRKDQMVDHFSRIFSVGAVSLPTFWVGLFLQLLFYRYLGLLPLGDQLSMDIKLLYEIPNITGFLLFDSLITGNFVILQDVLIHMILPGITIALYPLGLVARMTRSALLEILNEDYISAARSYGLPERLVLWKYALKNSLGPTVTVVTLSIGYTLVNTFLIEAIFSWPGIGSYISSAVISLDYPAIMGVTIFSAVAYVILNLVADIIIAFDPRVRT